MFSVPLRLTPDQRLATGDSSMYQTGRATFVNCTPFSGLLLGRPFTMASQLNADSRPGPLSDEEAERRREEARDETFQQSSIEGGGNRNWVKGSPKNEYAFSESDGCTLVGIDPVKSTSEATSNCCR